MAATPSLGSAPNKSFGELFGEAKSKLDDLQKGLASIFPSMPGMPAGKYFDLAIGVDFEQTIAPPCPVFPVPHVGMVFDILAAIMNAIADALPTPPEPAEGEKAPVTVLSVASTIANMMKPSVQAHGRWINNAGTPVLHLPAMFLHLIPMAIPTSSSEMWMGSSTVLADGGPFSTLFHPALSCNAVGLPSIPRLNKKPRPVMDLMLPTSMLLAITSGGKPVLVGGPPTIDLFQLLFSLGLKALGKLWKKVGDGFQALIDKIAKKNQKLADILQHVKCKLFGEPVDAATGRVVHTNTDFDLPGPIPLTWERTYYSDAEEHTSLGYNWHHSYNIGLYDVDNGYALRWKDGREISLPYLNDGDIFYHRIEQLFWQKDKNGYFLTDSDKLTYRFGKKKNRHGFEMIAEIQDVQGFHIDFQYNYHGNLTNIIDSCGRLLTIENDQNGHVIAVSTKVDGQKRTFIQYRYDELHNMVGTMDVNNAVKSFQYDNHLLVKLTNQSNHSFYWEYEGKGDNARCIHTWGDEGVLEYWSEYQVNEDGSGVTRASNSLGHTTEYHYNSKKLIYKIVDANGGITRQIYNDYQELEVLISPEGGCVKYKYNSYGKITSIVNENEESSSFIYDDNQNLIYASSPGGKSIGWQYDDSNRLISRTSVDGNTVNYLYDSINLVAIMDEKKRKVSLQYDKQHNLTKVLYPNGLSQTWGYDQLGNLVHHKDIRNNQTQYGYDHANQLVYIKEQDGNEHHFDYDVAGNIIKARDYGHLVRFEYGPLGLLRGREQNGRSVRFNYDTEMQLRSIVNEGGEIYRFALDPVGNVVSEWGFDGLHRRYHRDNDGRVVKVLRPEERWTTYNYDSIGNIVSEEHNDGSMAAYKYDADGQLIEAFNETSHVVLQRDNAGRVIKEIQDGYEVTKRYDKEGNLVHTGTSLGASIQMKYDEWGLLTQMEAVPNDNMETPSPLELQMKELQEKIAQLSGQKRASSDNPTNKPIWMASFQRDSAGLEVQRQLSGEVVVKSERDQLGRVTRRTIGAHNIEQSRNRYNWGIGNKLHRIVNELTKATVDFNYDAFDNLVSAAYENNGVVEHVYRTPDMIGNLFKTKDRSDRKYSKGGQLQEDENYCYYYDGEGNMVFKEFKQSDHTHAVDKREKLKSKDIQLQRSGYGWEYEWGGNGMLHKVINPGGREITFFYDPLGRRTAKIVHQRHAERSEESSSIHNTVTRFLWDGNVPIHEWQYQGQYPPQQSVAEEGMVQDKEPIENLVTWLYEVDSFVPCAKFIEDKQYSIVADYLGTPTHAFDQEGSMVWERELDIYGAVKKQTGAKAFIPQLYQGQYVDEETGLAYNRFRYYDNESGNYISQDPIGLASGEINFYSYVRDANGNIDLFGWSSLIPSENLKSIDLTNPNWRNVSFDGNQKGIVYVLKDADTGELLKVGKSEVGTFKGRFEKYATAGNKTGRNLSLDVFTVDKSALSSVESIEKSMREGLEKSGHKLPWDNTNNRLGRSGPGTPFTRLNKKLRGEFEWDADGKLTPKHVH